MLQKMAVLLGLFLFFGCAHQASRGPSSALLDLNFDITQRESYLDRQYQAIIETANPGSEMNELVDDLLRTYHRAQFLLNSFDLELDQKLAQSSGASDLLSSDTYKRLLSLWSLQTARVDKLSYIYGRMLGDYTQKRKTWREAKARLEAFKKSRPSGANRKDVESTSDQQVQALTIDVKNKEGEFRKYKDSLSEFNKNLNSFVDKPERIFLQDLIGEIYQRNKETAMGDKDQPTLLNVRQVLLDTPQAYSKAYKVHGPAIKANADRESGEIRGEREILDVIREQVQREPNSVAVIQPDSGKSGNINGSSFPAGMWALTYDDGPSKIWTPKILDNLKRHGVKVTFFWLAQNLSGADVKTNIVERAKTEGHILANHSYSHANLPKQSEKGLQREIVESTNVEEAVYGYKPSYFRCPYGACSNGSRIRELIASKNMVHVFWNVDSLDWQDKNPDSVYQRVIKQMQAQGRGIILFHDIHQQSHLASEKVMGYLKDPKNNITAVTIPEGVSAASGGGKSTWP